MKFNIRQVIFLIYLFLTGLLHFLISSLFRHVKLFSHHRRTQDFTIDGVHEVGRWATESRGQKSPSRVHGKAPIGSLETKSPEAEAKCEISVQFQTFPLENLGFNEYRSRSWKVRIS